MNEPILLVEDEENDVLFLKSAFKKAGIANPIYVAADGQAALDYLHGIGQFSDREKFPLPGLVLLDLKLPYVMGLDVLRHIRVEIGLASIVIVLTSSNLPEDVEEAFRCGANAYLVEPNDSEEDRK